MTNLTNYFNVQYKNMNIMALTAWPELNKLTNPCSLSSSSTVTILHRKKK